MMKGVRTVLRECRDYVECFVIPATAVILPWWLAVRFFRTVAYVPWLYRHNTEACAEGARYLGLLGDDEAAWKRACKTNVMIDLADVFLLATRGTGYQKKYICENLTDLLQDGSMIFFPHYGAGMWVLRLIVFAGKQPNLLVNRTDSSITPQNLLNRLRDKILRYRGIQLIYADEMNQVKHALKNGEIILVSPDMPVSKIKSFQPQTALGRLNVMSQFFILAQRRALPVINVTLGVDVRTGLRAFDAELYTGLTAEAYAQQFALQTATAIRHHPHLWRMMVMAPQVMLPSAETMTETTE